MTCVGKEKFRLERGVITSVEEVVDERWGSVGDVYPV